MRKGEGGDCRLDKKHGCMKVNMVHLRCTHWLYEVFENLMIVMKNDDDLNEAFL